MNKLFSKLGGGKIQKASLLLNFIGLIFFTGLVWRHREAIADKLYIRSEKPSDKSLLEFNNEKLPIINDSLFLNGYNDTIDILFMGNSLTTHQVGVVEGFMEGQPRGMAASTIENDYVHRLVMMLSERDKVNVRFSVSNIAEFERQFNLRPFPWSEKLADAKVKQPDILIVQIGENVSTDVLRNNYEEFIREYVRLLERYPISQRIITLPFWMDIQKHDAITEVALRTRSRLADLSHLGHRNSDPRNFAKYYKEYSNPSVGEHPSDYGFEQIAKVIFTEIQ